MNAAILAAHSGVTIFQVAFARWVQQNDPTAFTAADRPVAARAKIGDRHLVRRAQSTALLACTFPDDVQ